MASNEIEIPGSDTAVGKLKKIAAGQALNRRRFLAALGMTGAAAGTGLLSGCSSSTSSTVAGASATSAQTDVLNFALNLEYLEATFYSYVTTGADINTANTKVNLQNSGTVTGGPAAPIVFTGPNAQQITDMLNEIYFDEWNHVATLQGLLGSAAVFRPAINLSALGAITANNALSISRLFEDVGVTAYNGAVGLLSSSDLTFASQILAVEGFHVGALRLVSIQNPTMAAYLQADSLDVAPMDLGSAALEDTGPTSAGGIFSTAASNASVNTTTANTPAGFPFSRTPSQVLSIVYGPGAPAGTSAGGFFPKGVNGKINTV